MKRILTSTLLLILTTALIPADAGAGTSQARNAVSQSQRSVRVGVVISPRMPLGISTATAILTGDEIVLRYAVNNQSGGQLEAFELLAFVLDKDGRVKGGEGWTVRAPLPARRSGSFTRMMKSRLSPGDRLTLTMRRATGKAGTFEVDQTELNNLLSPRTAR